MSEPLFLSIEGALSFAFSENYEEAKRSLMSRMASGPSRPGNGLGGTDGFGQSGMILAAVERLQPVHRYTLAARFSPPFGECKCGSLCCRGYKHHARWLESVIFLTEHVIQAVPATLSHLRLREGIVRKYFGDKVRLGDLADHCGVHRNTASAHASSILTMLKSEEKQARITIRAELETSGLVGTA